MPNPAFFPWKSTALSLGRARCTELSSSKQAKGLANLTGEQLSKPSLALLVLVVPQFHYLDCEGHSTYIPLSIHIGRKQTSSGLCRQFVYNQMFILASQEKSHIKKGLNRHNPVRLTCLPTSLYLSFLFLHEDHTTQRHPAGMHAFKPGATLNEFN